MRTTKLLTSTTLATLKRFAFQEQANRVDVGLVVAVTTPADFLSQEQVLLPMPIPEHDPGLADNGNRPMRLPESFRSPAGSVGRFSGATACRTGWTTANRFYRPSLDRARDYPSPANQEQGRTQRANRSYPRWHLANVRLSTASK